MYSQIIDQQTYSAVVAAAPSVPGEYEALAEDIVSTLRDCMAFAPSHERDGQVVYQASLKELTARLGHADVTPSQTGRMLDQLGLLKARRRDGYHVYWTRAQIEILAAALLEVDDVE